MSMKKRKDPSGISLIEILIAAIILAGVFAIAFSLLATSSTHVESLQAGMHLETQAREVINQIAQDLRMTRFSSITSGGSSVVVSTTPYADLQCRLPGPLPANFDSTAYLTAHKANPNNLWTREVRYRWALSPHEGATLNGVDDDRNGVVDDGVIKKSETTYDTAGAVLSTADTTICHFVQLKGLQFLVLAPDKLQITLTLEKADPSHKNVTFVKTVQTVIDLRN